MSDASANGNAERCVSAAAEQRRLRRVLAQEEREVNEASWSWPRDGQARVPVCYWAVLRETSPGLDHVRYVRPVMIGRGRYETLDGQSVLIRGPHVLFPIWITGVNGLPPGMIKNPMIESVRVHHVGRADEEGSTLAEGPCDRADGSASEPAMICLRNPVPIDPVASWIEGEAVAWRSVHSRQAPGTGDG